MAYADLAAKVTGDIIDADYLNQIKANFEAGAPALFTAKGSMIIGTGSKTAVELTVGTDGQHPEALSSETSGIDWISLTLTSVARYKVAGTATIGTATDTIINYATLVYDPASCVTTGASWKYVVPATGYYLVTASARLQSSANWTAGEVCYLKVYAGATLKGIIAATVAEANGTYIMFVTGGSVFSFTAADEVSIKIYHNTGSDETLDSDGDYGWVSIARMA